MYYTPYGVRNPDTFNWNNLNTNNLGFNQTGIGNWGASWANASNLPYSQNSVQNAAISAAKNGQANLAKVMAGVVTYGPARVGMISQIILATKGKSITSPSQLSDQDAQDILRYNNGNLNPNDLGNRQTTSFLGIPISYIAVGLGGLLVYSVMNKK